MKKIIFSLALILMGTIYGAYLKNVPQTFTQPDGTIINVFATGDEYYNWLHDENNYTILQDHSNGYYVYANLEDNKLVPTKHIVGVVNPKTTELTPAINIEPEKIHEIRVNASQKYFKSAQNKQTKQAGPFSRITKGILNNIVVFISFVGQDGWSETLEDYERIYNIPSEYSMYNYYQEISAGQLDIQSHFFPKPQNGQLMSYVDSHPIDYYFEYDSIINPIGYKKNELWDRRQTLMRNSVKYVENEVINSGINIDLDNDSWSDAVSFVVNNTRNWGGAFWPHVGSLYGTYIDNIFVHVYSIQSYWEARPGVFFHEMGHLLGAPDLYGVINNIQAIGNWDLMAFDCGQHTSMFLKQKYFDWIVEIPLISSSGTYTLFPLANSPLSAYKILSPYSDDEYFLVEYRKAIGIFESCLPGSGLIIYRIRKQGWSGNNEFYPNFPAYIYRPFGTNTNSGDLRKAHYSLDVDRTIINDYTEPSIFLTNGSAGGINITNIGFAGETIQFDVHFPSSTIDFVEIEQFDEGLLELKWNLVFEDWVKQYNVYRSIDNSNNFEKIGTVEHPNTIFEDTTLVNNSNYYYKIVAEDTLNIESEASKIVNLTVELSQAIPQNLIAEPLSERRVYLKWDGNAENWISKYNIYRKEESMTSYDLISGNSVDDTQFEDNNLTAGKSYHYKVISIDRYNNERGFSETSVKAFSTPTSSDKILEINEDEIYVFQTTDFEFSDLDNHTFDGIIINSQPENTKGKLLYNHSVVSNGQVIEDIIQLRFEPAENQFGSPFTEFNFKVIDSSGDKSSETYTFTFNVLPVNDNPNDFYLEFPINNDTLKVTNTNLLEDFVFRWTASGDVDNENILYDFVGSGGIDFLSTDSINTNEVSFDVKYITSKIKSSSSSSGTWIVIATDGKGNTKAVNGPFTIVLDATKIVINKYNLEQNFPNPFNSRTTIIYTLPIDTNVKIEIFDINGKNIYTLINEYQESGIKVLIWDGIDRFGNTVNSGIYFYRIVSNKFVKTRKLLFLK